jgi:hypothetical protein
MSLVRIYPSMTASIMWQPSSKPGMVGGCSCPPSPTSQKGSSVKTLVLVRDHSLFMTGGGLAKKGVGHEVFFSERGGAPKHISSEGGGVELFIIVEKNLTCNDYCNHRSFFFILIHANIPFPKSCRII